MIQVLRDLQTKGWMQCYRYETDPQRFDPIDQFKDREVEDPIQLTYAATLWWSATESGLSALKEDRARRGINRPNP